MTSRFGSMALVALVTCVCCAGTAQAQVDPANPFPTPPVDQSIPPLPGATGPLLAFEAPISQKGPASLHGGAFTWGPDLLPGGTPDREAWKNSFFPLAPPPDAIGFTAAPGVMFDVEQALVAADATLGALDAGAIGDAFVLFKKYLELQPGASVDIEPPSAPLTSFYGYRPVRARWLRSQWGRTSPMLFQPEKKFVYADWQGFNDIRLQGARFYCAARRVQKVQGSQPMSLGERVGFSVKLLGHTIDFLVVEPTVVLAGPKSFLGFGDAIDGTAGAQAFTVPLLLGTRVTPIRGIGLPGFGEARVPVSFIATDTEVRTQSDKRPVFVGYNVSGFKFGPSFVNMHSKEYSTVTHADAVVSAGFVGPDDFHVGGKFTLFYLGPLRVFGSLDLHYEVGTLDLPDTRVLVGFPAGWPPARTGMLFQNPKSGERYHDGGWAFVARRGSSFFQWEVQPDGQKSPFWRLPILPALRPHDIRALTDDDHVLDIGTRLTLDFGIGGELGVSAGPFEVTATVEGRFVGQVAQQHVMRDALMAQDPLAGPTGFPGTVRPVTALSVRPRQTAGVDFDGLTAMLHFYLDLGFFGDIEFTKTFFSVKGTKLADYDSDDSLSSSDEQFMLRLGTGATAGKPMTQPAVLSHLPGGSAFTTFLQDVPACLADTTPLPDTPEPCVPTVDPGEPPRVDICLYGPSAVLQENLTNQLLPSGACSNPQSWLAGTTLTPGQKLCLTKYLFILCEPTSKQQVWEGFSVVSRVWNLEPGINKALLEVAEECGEAFVGKGEDIDPSDPATKKAITEIAEGMVSAGPCRPDATLIPDGAIIEAIDPTKAPAAKPAPACQP